MRARHLLVLGLVAAAAAGSWRLWGHGGRTPFPPAGSVVHAGADVAVRALTAADEGDLLPTTGAARGPLPLPTVPRHRDVPSRRPRTFAPAPRPERPSRGSAAALPGPADKPQESPRQTSSAPPQPAPSPAPSPAGRVEPAAPPSGAATASSSAAETGGAGGHGVAQDAAGPASQDPSAGGGHEVPPFGAPPRLVPPRVIDTAGTAYPGEAFYLTVRRQDLGPELAVEGAEGTVALRALISTDGSVRSVDVATSSGSPVLDLAAAEAVRHWRFTPATRDGVPIDAYAVLRIRYVVR